MADAARPLTIAHQGLAACLAVICCDVTRGPDIEDVLAMAAEMLPQAHGDGPLAEPMLAATRGVLGAWPGRQDRDGGALRWNAACSAGAEVVRAYYRARAGACHDRIFPQPEAEGSA